jgi:hypothetical protein
MKDDIDLLGVAGLAVGIIGIFLAIYFYIKSKRKTQISYIVQSTQLLGRSRSVLPEEVSILYGGDLITNLINANFIFWNSGNTSIKHDDVVPGSPIVIALAQNSHPLKASLLKCSLPQNGIFLRAMSGEDTEISFTYLDPRHGFNIELLYEGEVSAPTVSGTIIGMPQGLNRVYLERQTNKRSYFETVGMAITVVLGFTMGSGLWDWHIPANKYEIIFGTVIALILGIIIPFSNVFLSNFIRRALLKTGVPQDLST